MKLGSEDDCLIYALPFPIRRCISLSEEATLDILRGTHLPDSNRAKSMAEYVSNSALSPQRANEPVA